MLKSIAITVFLCYNKHIRCYGEVMKFIHCSDLHLDSAFKSLPTEIARVRKEEVICSFERLCEYANNNEITAVIIAGDMFDTLKVSIKTRERVFGAIKNCKNVDFLYVSGNHDKAIFDNEEFILPENFKLFSNDWTAFNYGNVNISGVSFDACNTQTIYDTLTLESDRVNIVVMHGQVAGYKSNEQAELISIPKLVEKNIDYLALGHIHEFSSGKIDNRGVYVYSGCLEGRGFDEIGKKGFVLLEVADKTVNYKFVEFNKRGVFEVEFDVTSISSQNDLILSLKGYLSKNYEKDGLFKIILTGETIPEISFDLPFIVNRLSDIVFYVKIYDRTSLKINIEDYEFDKTIKGEFIRSVLSSNESEEMKKQIIKCGLNALKGEEV